MYTIGVEGPALAGKSSTIRGLVSRMVDAEGLAVRDAPCFVEWSEANGRVLPPLVPDSWSEQEAAVQFFLEADDSRRSTAGAGLVASEALLLLDRTSWTVLAHTASLGRLGLLEVGDMDGIRAAVHARRPDVLLYLDTKQEDLEARRLSRPGFPSLLVDREFNRMFRAALLSECPEAIVIDGSQPLAEVVSAAAAVLSRFVAGA